MVQQFFAVMNPLLSLLLAGAFATLALRWTSQRHLGLISVAFALTSIAFLATAYGIGPNADFSRYVANVGFFSAVTLACVCTIMRAGLRVPVPMYIALVALTVAGFAWFEVVMSSTLGRIYVMAIGFNAISLVTLVHLRRKPNWALADYMIAAAVCFGMLLSIVRPILAHLHVLDIGAEGTFLQSTYWATVVAFTPILSVGVGFVFLAAIALDIYEQVKTEANHDYLTGLLNRRGFETLVESDLTTAKKPALLIADIDDFKKVNDTYGHQTGDAVIRHVAEILAHHGQALYAARIGGEEFALYYSDMERPPLRAIADDIRLALAQSDGSGPPVEKMVTLSIGLHWRDAGEGLAQMLHRADQALYRAKRAGKDRVENSAIQLHSIRPQARA